MNNPTRTVTINGPKVTVKGGQPYSIDTAVQFPPLELIDIPLLVAACTEQWTNQTLCRVNESVVRLGVVQGEFHWHKHDNEDEFFYVIAGRLIIDLDHESVVLGPRQALTVPKGARHRTRAPERSSSWSKAQASSRPGIDRRTSLFPASTNERLW